MEKMCCIGNVFGFTPDGCIFYARINYPGSCADSYIAEDLEEKLNVLPPEFKVLADSGFTRSDRVLTPFKTGALDQVYDEQVVEAMVLQHNAVVSIRQAAEWGMRGIQGAFSRLKTPLTRNVLRRKRLV